MTIKPFTLTNILITIITVTIISTSAYAKNDVFHSPKFELPLNTNINLISKNEQPNDGFYQYLFASSNNDNAKLQMRVIVSAKKPEKNQSLEDFQTNALANMSVMLIESYGLYQYLDTPENKKVLSSKPNKLQLGGSTYAGMTMHFGTIDASFLVTNSHNMTYAFTLISNDANKQARINNLDVLTKKLESIKFN